VSLQVEFHPAAREEFDAAMAYYEAARPHLGFAFLEAVQEATTHAQRVPLAGSPVSTGLRRILVRRFPYYLLYAVEETRIFLLAVAHFRRRPRYWQQRLR
jgi:plasmid stabilization system protein ParE